MLVKWGGCRSAIVLLLALLCIVTNASLRSVGLALQNADFAIFTLYGERIGDGPSAFYYQQPWGGTLWTEVRMLFVHFLRAIGMNGDFISAHLFFLYVIQPLIVFGAFFLLMKDVVSFRGAVFGGVLAAVGLEFWVHFYGNDFYWGGLLLAIVMIIGRMRIRDPFLDWNARQLFGMGFLAGLAVYTSRSVLSIVAPLFWTAVLTEIFAAALWRPERRRWVRGLRWTIVTFVALYFWIKIFGFELGYWKSSWVRAHAFPNLKIAALFAAVLLLWASWQEWPALRRTFLKSGKGLGFLGGAMVGFFPEIGFRVQHGFPKDAGTQIAWLNEALIVFCNRLPAAFRELLCGYDHLNHSFGMERQFLLILGVAAVVTLFYRARREARLRPIAYGVVVTMFLFCAVRTYDHGPTRYLFHILPGVFVGFALLWERLSKRQSFRWQSQAIAIGVLVVSVVYLVREREASRMAYAHSGIIERMRDTSSTFKERDLAVVVSDDYWETANIEALSPGKPHFVSTGRALGPAEGFQLAAHEPTIGVLLTHEAPGNRRETIDLLGRHYRLKFLKENRGHVLYVGTMERTVERTMEPTMEPKR